jgi:hypothetical protein
VNAEELERRRPVWTALAELWLDNELDELDGERLAEVLARSTFDELELRAIHDSEVAPAVAANLDSIAGEWAGFDPQWLEERCRETATRRTGVFGRVRELLAAPRRDPSVREKLDDLLARVLRLRGRAGAP